jgi:RNA polymerase sigma factor (TIGR02999 family)
MPPDDASRTPPVTQLLADWQRGDVVARDRLFDLVHPELRRLAAAAARYERPDHTLDAPALVNELYLRLSAGQLQFQDRVHFFAIAARTMRRILIDHARAHVAEKRGGDADRVTLSAVDGWIPARSMEDILALEQALTRLESLEPRLAQVVEMRFYSGLLETEVAAALGVSTITVKRDWRVARAWLLARLRRTP